MAKIFVILFVFFTVTTILHGFPQKPHDKPQKSNLDTHQQNHQIPQKPQQKHEVRKTRDVEQKPIDRSQISTLPATIDSPDKDSSEESHPQHKPLDRSQISTLPATIDFDAKDDDVIPSSNDKNKRATRSAERDESDESNEESKEKDPKESSEESSDRQNRSTENENKHEKRRGNVKIPADSDVKIQPVPYSSRN